VERVLPTCGFPRLKLPDQKLDDSNSKSYLLVLAFELLDAYCYLETTLLHSIMNPGLTKRGQNLDVDGGSRVTIS
jgi:hypothetical protein